jgi:hypothetical protein
MSRLRTWTQSDVTFPAHGSIDPWSSASEQKTIFAFVICEDEARKIDALEVHARRVLGKCWRKAHKMGLAR